MLYRLLQLVIGPGIALAMAWRTIKGKETRTDLAERLGRGRGEPGAIWVHGASIGELNSARALIQGLREAHSDVPIVVTCNTVTGREVAKGWGIPQMKARLAPLDAGWVVRRFLRRWKPRVLINLENEIWPNRMLMAKCPILFVSAWISERSAARWRWALFLLRPALRKIDYLAPQDPCAGQRFLELGLRPEALGPPQSLKSYVTLDPPNPQDLSEFSQQFERGETLLAASTHKGEDEIILAALVAAPEGLRLIIAPRHPDRGDDIRRLVTSLGMSVSQRSRGENPDTKVYIADTLGEMALWYSLAGITFVGGSLTDIGGHTPYEPARFQSAILFGPHVGNFVSDYRELVAVDGARQIHDATSLANALEDLSLDPAREAMIDAAATLLKDAEEVGSATQEVLSVIARLAA